MADALKVIDQLKARIAQDAVDRAVLEVELAELRERPATSPAPEGRVCIGEAEETP